MAKKANLNFFKFTIFKPFELGLGMIFFENLSHISIIHIISHNNSCTPTLISRMTVILLWATVQYSTVQYSTCPPLSLYWASCPGPDGPVPCGVTVQDSTVQYRTVLYSVAQPAQGWLPAGPALGRVTPRRLCRQCCTTRHYSTVQYSTVQYSTSLPGQVTLHYTLYHALISQKGVHYSTVE